MRNQPESPSLPEACTVMRPSETRNPEMQGTADLCRLGRRTGQMTMHFQFLSFAYTHTLWVTRSFYVKERIPFSLK